MTFIPTFCFLNIFEVTANEIFNVHRIISNVSFFHSFYSFVSFFFFLNIIQFIQVLISVLVFSKNQLLALLGLYNLYLYSMLRTLILIFIIYFLLLSLGVICCNFPKLFRANFPSYLEPSSLIFSHSSFLI